MKNVLNIILYPVSLVYGLIIFVRNWLFDKEIIPSKSFDIPIISIGNLSVGGTGKTPHTEFLLSIFQEQFKTGVLSRGYKRKTKGFKLADKNSTSRIIGDEPYQMHLKFPEVTVAVDEKRVHGVKKLLELQPDLQLIVLDDAFQHRHIRPGFSIILTDYSRLYNHDHLMPVGRLREPKKGSRRADMIVVTKCPEDIKPIDIRLIETELKPEAHQSLFFSCPVYKQIRSVFPDSTMENITIEKIRENNIPVLLVTGIVSPKPIAEYLSDYTENLKTLTFPDHHTFQSADFNQISKTLDTFSSPDKVMIVTEKDAARLMSNPIFPESLKAITFALPIEIKILNNQEEIFIQKIKHYVIENSRNR